MSSWLQFHTMLIHCLVYCVCCEFRHLHLLTPLLNPETLVSPNSLCVHSPSCPLPFRSPLLPDEHRTQLRALQCASDLTRWWRREESYLCLGTCHLVEFSAVQCSGGLLSAWLSGSQHAGFCEGWGVFIQCLLSC